MDEDTCTLEHVTCALANSTGGDLTAAGHFLLLAYSIATLLQASMAYDCALPCTQIDRGTVNTE